MTSNKGYGDIDDIYVLDSWDICWSGMGRAGVFSAKTSCNITTINCVY